MRPLKWEIEAILPVLEDPANADKSSEEIAMELLTALKETAAKRALARERAAERREERQQDTSLPRLAVVLQYSLDQGETWHHGVLGPFLAGAPAEARRAAEGIVGRPTQPGQGRFMLVPAFASTRDAWAAIAPTAEERRTALELARIRRASGWNPWARSGPVCRCGVRRSDARDGGDCPVHPERRAA